MRDFLMALLARWRTLHEIAVTAAFISQSGEDVAERYLAHFPCEELKSARLFEEHRRALGERRLPKRVTAGLEAQVNLLKQKFGEEFRHDYGWAAHALQLKRVTFVDIERAVNLTYMRPYYRAASEQVHSSVRGAVLRGGLIQQDPTAVSLLAGPSNYGFADAAMNSARSLLLVTVTLIKIEPTVDTNVYAMILAKWYGPLAESFIKAQANIEMREARMKVRPKARKANPPRATRGDGLRGN